MGKLAEAIAHVPRKIVYAEMAGYSVMVNEQVAVNQVWSRGERGNEAACVTMPEGNSVQSSKRTADRRRYLHWYPDAVVMAQSVKRTNPERGRGLMRVAAESRLPKGEGTNTAEVAHHITDDTGGATTGDHHVVHTVVHPPPARWIS